MGIDTRIFCNWKMAVLCGGLLFTPSVAATAPSVKPERNPSGSRVNAAQPSMSRPAAAAAAANAPTRRTKYEMLIGFHVTTIDDINWNNGTFRADLYWWVRYPKPGPELTDEKMEGLEFTNGDIDQNKLQERKELANSLVYASYRTIGRFHFNSDFRKYPFDKQLFPIVMEHESMPVTDLVLKDDQASYNRFGAPENLQGLSDSVRIPDLDIKRVSRDFSDHEYRTDFGDPTAQGPTRFSRVALSVEVERHFAPYLVKIIVPLLIILLLAYLAFFVPAQDLDVAAGLTVTSVLACIAVQFTLNDEMPDVGYIITSDHIFHLSYFLIMLTMAETVVTFNIEKKGNAMLSRRIENFSRVAFPTAFVFGMVLIVIDGLSG